MARAKKQPSEEVLSSDMIDTGTKSTSLLDNDKPKKRGRTNTQSVQLDDDLYDAWKEYSLDVYKEKRELVYFSRTVTDLLAQFLMRKGYPKG